MVEELNRGADRKGDAVGETTTTGELAGEKLGELATLMGNDCKCDESKPAFED